MRALVLALLLGCRSTGEPSAVVDSAPAVDPFDPRANCERYRAHARTLLDEVDKILVGVDAASPEALQAMAAAISKQRSALGPLPLAERAIEHHRAASTTLDGLISNLQRVAAVRGDGPKSPELANAEPELKKHRRALEGERTVLTTLCVVQK